MAGIVAVKGNIFGKCTLAILGSIGIAIIYGIRDNYLLLYGPIATALNLNIYYESHIFHMLGTLVSQLPAAYVAHKFSAKWVMFFGVAINVVCTLLTPMVINLGYERFILLRMFEGIGHGATFPAMHCMIASWSPPNQRTVISTIIYASLLYAGNVADIFSELLDSKFEWQTIFYIFGGLSCIWLLLWSILVEDNPNKESFINQREHEMITATLSTGEKKIYSYAPVPWGRILTSVPFWAILITHSFYICGTYIFYIGLANQIFRKHFSFGTHNLATWIFSITLAIVLDFLRAKRKISTTVARKIATGIATLIPAICALILCLITWKNSVTKIILAIGVVSMGGYFPGFLSNHIDIAPKYAGILAAITNTFATIPNIILPHITNFVRMGDDRNTAWLIFMGLAIECFIAGFFVFVILGSGEEQSWNKSTHSNCIENRTIKAPSLYPELKKQEFENIHSWHRIYNKGLHN